MGGSGVYWLIIIVFESDGLVWISLVVGFGLMVLFFCGCFFWVVLWENDGWDLIRLFM